MKKIWLGLFVLILISGCGAQATPDLQATIAVGIAQTLAAQPTATFTLQPTPDVQATVNAGILATQAAQPTAIPTPIPSATPIPQPTAPPVVQPTATSAPQTDTVLYVEFYAKFAEHFEGSKALMSTPVDASLHEIVFNPIADGSTNLRIRTTSEVSQINATLMGFVIGVLQSLVDEPSDSNDYYPEALPEKIGNVRMVFLDEQLQEQGHFITTWAEFVDYANKKIDFNTMFAKADWKLP